MRRSPIRRIIYGVVFIALGIHTYITNFGDMKNISVVFVGYGVFSLGLGIWWQFRPKQDESENAE